MTTVTTVTGLAQSVSFADVTAGVLSLAAGLIVLYLLIKGVKIIFHMLKNG